MTTLNPIRAAEAMRQAAAKLIEGDIGLLRRQGREDEASGRIYQANQIRALLPEVVLADLPEMAPDEQTAFEAAAKTASFNVTPGSNCEYMHPITQRALSVWRAAVRWTRETDQSN